MTTIICDIEKCMYNRAAVDHTGRCCADAIGIHFIYSAGLFYPVCYSYMELPDNIISKLKNQPTDSETTEL